MAGCDRENLACVCGVEPHSDLPEQEDEKRGKEICGCGVSFSKSTSIFIAYSESGNIKDLCFNTMTKHG